MVIGHYRSRILLVHGYMRWDLKLIKDKLIWIILRQYKMG